MVRQPLHQGNERPQLRLDRRQAFSGLRHLVVPFPLLGLERRVLGGTGGLEPFRDLHLAVGRYDRPPAFESGGAGLVSTLDDYAAFAGMPLEDLMSDGPSDDILWDETIENYYRAVETLFKDEDILIGYSQGGPVAFEVAKKLEDKGHKVGRVIMLDAPRPGVDYGQESRPEMMATAAAIFAGKTDADITGFDMTDETTEEAFFRKYLKENFGDKADKELLHSIFETYLVYSSNVSNKLEMAGTIQAPIDSAELGGKGVSKENPWSKYSESEGRAYVFDGPAKDHLAFLSKYRKELAKVVSGYIRRA